MALDVIAPHRRDSIIWTLLFVSAVLGFVSAHTHLVPLAYSETVADVSALIGFIAGLCKASPLGPGRSVDMEPPKDVQ